MPSRSECRGAQILLSGDCEESAAYSQCPREDQPLSLRPHPCARSCGAIAQFAECVLHQLSLRPGVLADPPAENPGRLLLPRPAPLALDWGDAAGKVESTSTSPAYRCGRGSGCHR